MRRSDRWYDVTGVAFMGFMTGLLIGLAIGARLL